MAVSNDIHVDTFVREPAMHRERPGFFAHLSRPAWQRFMDERVRAIFERGGMIVDIGGGLRLDGKRTDKEDPEAVRKYGAFLADPRVNYVVTDYTDTYAPDRVEDVHALSFADASVDAILCVAVLEHVFDPKKAAEEITRVLKPGGTAFVYAPFMYRYHAHKRDYRDYYRYSKDGWAYLFRGCSRVELCPVRGLFETLLRFTPLHRFAPFVLGARALDVSCAAMRAVSEVQTSGYNVHLTK